MCNPLTSAACAAKIAAEGAAGLIPGDPIVPNIGGVAGSAAKAAAGGVTNAAVGGLAGAIQAGLGTLAKDMVAWWINLPSPDLTTDPVPHVLQGWLFPFTAAVAVISIIVAAGRMALTRKATPLADVGTGLLIMAITAAAGTILPTLLLRAGDAYSTYVLNSSTGGQFSSRFVALLSFSGAVGIGSTAIVLVIGMIAMVLATVQALLLLFRQGAVIILAGTLPLAAAGTMNSLTKPWLKRVTGWELALIFYKPCAATVYATGFELIGQGTIPRDVLVGFAVLLLSLVALPVLMRLFNWTTGQVESASGGGVLGAVIGGAAAVGALRGSGGMSAADQARTMGSGALGGGTGGPGGGTGSGPGGGTGGGPGGGTGGGPGAGSGGGAGAGSGGGTGANTGPGGPGSGTGTGAGPGGGTGAGPGAAGGRPAAAAGAGSAGSGAAGARPAQGATTAGGAGVPAGASAGGAPAAAAAAGGPPGMIVLGAAQAAQAASSAATRLADGAVPPGDRS
jgi:hypothetical protein